MAFCVECKKYKKAFKSTQYTEPIHIVVSSIQLSLGTCISCVMVQQEAPVLLNQCLHKETVCVVAERSSFANVLNCINPDSYMNGSCIKMVHTTGASFHTPRSDCVGNPAVQTRT